MHWENRSGSTTSQFNLLFRAFSPRAIASLSLCSPQRCLYKAPQGKKGDRADR
ncbi:MULTISPECIES: hypothetical protein [unclassified Nostoc]|uniref:hypothetical protein n=1 Tax=unclassified Nostoc TaxID=2593658 RepID=UPI0016726284|nr:hypothetical protein [Nostoc sp. 'Peltigera membranacea cyanobiont' 232]